MSDDSDDSGSCVVKPVKPIKPESGRTALLKNIPISNQKAKESLLASYRLQFQKWHMLLLAGFNLCFYGLGSKRDILREFFVEKCGHACRLIFNGNARTISVRKILQTILRNVLHVNSLTSNFLLLKEINDESVSSIDSGLIKWVSYIDSNLTTKLFILINNIDSLQLRSAASQWILANLASCKNICLVASVDDIHAQKLWDMSHLKLFRFTFYEIVTFAPYTWEISTSKTHVESDSTTKLSILPTLTSNIRQSLLLLSSACSKSKSGLNFESWFSACQDAMIVTDQAAFNGYIQELRDHDLIEERDMIFSVADDLSHLQKDDDNNMEDD